MHKTKKNTGRKIKSTLDYFNDGLLPIVHLEAELTGLKESTNKRGLQ